VLYLDSSAIVKLVVPERESDALVAQIDDQPEVVSSALAWAEVVRAVARTGRSASDAERVIERIPMVPIDDAILRSAAELSPVTLRALDSIHLATALTLQDDLKALVTYDARLADAASGLRMPVLHPGVR
jgi:predicted nucleic acid-binding protein